MNTTLKKLGFTQDLEQYLTENELNEFVIGRIISEQKERYKVITESGMISAEITGNLRFTATSREDFPAAGDWVAMTVYEDNFAIIHRILPRKSIIARKAVGKPGEKQIIAVNVDSAFLVQAVDQDFNVNRLERYITICYDSGIDPVIVLTKIDLITKTELENIIKQISGRHAEIPVIAVNNLTGEGIEAIKNKIIPGKTYCLLGSSGVGKSTLINNLVGNEKMTTGAISNSTGKGKHVTTYRELVVLENGGILIDNPGMREVGIADADVGIQQTFDAIHLLSEQCKFSDCSHTGESGCAVKNAVENGELNQDYYHNYLRILKEKEFFEASAAERKRKEKGLSKIIKHYKKIRKNKR